MATPSAMAAAKSETDRGNVLRKSFSDIYAEELTEKGPNLFLDVTEATLAAIGTFIVADFRNIARREKIPKELAVEALTLPMLNVRVLEIAKLFEESGIRNRNRDFFNLRSRYEEIQKCRRSTCTVYYVEDENSMSECVHIVARDTLRKTILLTFRGSITLTDWYKDLKLMIGEVPNPLYGVKDQPEKVGIHLGFRDYLYGHAHNTFLKAVTNLVPSIDGKIGKSPENDNGDDLPLEEPPLLPEGTQSRIQVILQQLRELKLQYPSDRIYITGHSLGGALSLIAALEVAADPVLSSMPENAPAGIIPVSVFAIGNPKPGNRALSNAMLHLERTKKLRCCCVHNKLDPIPMLPANVGRRDVGFWHPGFRVLLYKRRFELGRSQASKPAIRLISKTNCCCCCCFCCGLKCRRSKWTLPKVTSLKAAKNMTNQRLNPHIDREYLERMLLQESQLGSVYLNDLYRGMWEDGCKVVQDVSAELSV